MRNKNIDLLRGVACMMVFYCHTMYFYYEHPDLESWYGLIMVNGAIGIEIFFVITGYLMVGKLLAQPAENIRIWELTKRLTMRLAPIYLIIMGLYWVANPQPIEKILPYLMFLQSSGLVNYLEPNAFFPVSWSITVTLYGTLILAKIVKSAKNWGINPEKALIWLWVALIGVRLLLIATGTVNTTEARMWTLMKLDPLILGALLYGQVKAGKLGGMGTQKLALAGGMPLLVCLIWAGLEPYQRQTEAFTFTGTLLLGISAFFTTGLALKTQEWNLPNWMSQHILALSRAALPFILVHPLVIEAIWRLTDHKSGLLGIQILSTYLGALGIAVSAQWAYDRWTAKGKEKKAALTIITAGAGILLISTLWDGSWRGLHTIQEWRMSDEEKEHAALLREWRAKQEAAQRETKEE